MEIEIGITCLLLVALTFVALIDMAFGELSDVGLRRLIGEAEDEPPTAATSFLTEILENRSRFRFTLTVTILILVVAISVLVASVTSRLIERSPEPSAYSHAFFLLIAVVAGVGLTAVARQLIPRLVASRNPEGTLVRLLPALRPFYRPLSLIAFAWHKSFDRPRRNEHLTETGVGDEDEDDNGDDLQALIDVGEEEGILEEEEGELIHSIIEFGDTSVNEVMTPRTEIVALPVTATVREARDCVVESKYSRLPVYRDQVDNIEGIIYVRDLLQCWAEGSENGSIQTLIRPTLFVPATKPVAELLEEMQKQHAQLAMVIDEYGGVAGLVTVEDILEEIVGEIEDEDTEREEVVEIIEAHDGYYDALGSTEVDKIERLFDFEIEEDDDATTIAGLVISELGYVPRAGERLTFRGLDVEVLEADERRIARLRLRRAEAKAAETE
ncbi:MAG TPA: hemolysin family protein [Pyrinomonadaceae bacterium]|jgi:CBS domain containing-hemolysin-like protein|nr:hemolysin family protein [Pyrinomonadaceae bacterium]